MCGVVWAGQTKTGEEDDPKEGIREVKVFHASKKRRKDQGRRRASSVRWEGGD